MFYVALLDIHLFTDFNLVLLALIEESYSTANQPIFTVAPCCLHFINQLHNVQHATMNPVE